MKRGRSALEGNQARAFIKAIPILEREFYKIGGELLLGGLEVVSVGQGFNLVIESCLGMELLPGWREAIHQFSIKYRQTGMSVTPKVELLYFII